jgi:hypothetical protein
MVMIKRMITLTILLMTLVATSPVHAWFDETHLAIAKAAGYRKWYNAAAADVSRIKLGRMEGYNHYHNSNKGIVITSAMVLEQAQRYDTKDPEGHLYGAILGSFRRYMKAKQVGKYAENHMAYLVHYVGDLSMPLHHTPYNAFNKQHHLANDGIIEDEVLANSEKIEIYAITIESEADLVNEVTRIANLAKKLGHRMEAEDRGMTKAEAYRQISHSASLLKAILTYIRIAGN